MPVALTFDDGPNGTSTVQLLDLLEKLAIPATFFVLGEMVSKFPKSLVKAASSPLKHEVGNHSWSHPNFHNLSDEEIKDQIGRTQSAIESTIGKDRASMLMRPPYGAATAKQKEFIRSLGYQVTLWNVDPEDWKGHKKPSEIADYLRSHIADGNVVLVHDIHPRSVKAMELLLPQLKGKFKFSTVSELNQDVVHTPSVKVHH